MLQWLVIWVILEDGSLQFSIQNTAAGQDDCVNKLQSSTGEHVDKYCHDMSLCCWQDDKI